MSRTTSLLVLGTHNRKKGIELAELLAPLGLQLKTLADCDAPIEVVEDGSSFAENARLKASQQATHLRQWVLGEDSGLVVDALDGAPGIYSARYSGPDATDDANNRHLLHELASVPPPQRTAHYVCHMSLADPDGQVRAESRAECQGRIRPQPAGTAGFGYDPLFEIIEYHQTFGQLGPAVKRLISHRSRAMRTMVPLIVSILQQGEVT